MIASITASAAAFSQAGFGAPPLGLDLYMPTPAGNDATPARIALGERLFFDTRLSVDGSIACASCHQPARGFTDGRRFGRGVQGRQTRRNVPSILNAGYSPALFWDGRAASLEEQVLAPITSYSEMGSDLEAVLARVAADSEYRQSFRSAFDEEISSSGLARALASFVRSRRSAGSTFDRYISADVKLAPEAEAGLRLFQGKARCVECHMGPLLTDGGFHNTGVGWGDGDLGRADVTSLVADRGRFKTPSLRNVALTAPYMHDGSLASLEDVVDFYANGGRPNPNLDSRIRRVRLSGLEKRQLIAYLETLTSAEYASRPVLFDSERSGQQEIFSLDSETGATRRLTHTGDGGRSGFAAWSPDGMRIAFVLTSAGNADIAVMAADGSSVRRLTALPGEDLYPTWSPDGRRIAFVSDRDGNREIYVMNADGTDQRNLTRHPAFDSRPAWSPDGRILFGSDRDQSGRPTPNLHIMNADGSDVRRLTSHPRADMVARFSPDGRLIVFASNRDGNQQIYVMNADGSNLRLLTQTAAVNGGPAWSPDGQWIVFHSERDGNSEIYVMKPDGSAQRRVTVNAAFDGHPSWR